MVKKVKENWQITLFVSAISIVCVLVTHWLTTKDLNARDIDNKFDSKLNIEDFNAFKIENTKDIDELKDELDNKVSTREFKILYDLLKEQRKDLKEQNQNIKEILKEMKK